MSLLEINSDKNKFWINEPKILYEDDGYLKFIPTADMTYIQKLNALSRFCIYSIILLIIFGKSKKWIYVPLVLLILILVLSSIYKMDPDSKSKEVKHILDERNEKFGMADNTQLQKIGLESGIVNSDGIVNVGERQFAPKYYRGAEKTLYTLEELDNYRTNTCRKPSRDNPFMNPHITDYNNGEIPSACNEDDDGIKDEITKQYNSDLFMDVEDVFDKANSQRQFYTVPNTAIPSNQTDFANWLYKSPVTCKEDQEQCLRYEDLRFKR